MNRGDDDDDKDSLSSVSVVIPVLNEEVSLPILLDYLTTKCIPQPNEIIISDGGSTDNTLTIAQTFQHDQKNKKNNNIDNINVILLESSSSSSSSQRPCRALSLNRGLQAATCQLVIFIHADTLPPCDFVIHMRNIMSCNNNNNNKKNQRRQGRRVALSAFRAIIVNYHNQKVNQFITFHHYIKTFYGPLLLYPYQTIFQGLLCFFGDQCIFGRRMELLEVGGYDVVPVLEEHSICKKMLVFGKCQLVTGGGSGHAVYCTTSDRRIALYGTLKVTLLHLFLSFGYELLGASSLEWLAQYYPPQHIVQEQFRLNQVVYQNMRFNHVAECQFLWKEIVQDRCYDHAKLSFAAMTTTRRKARHATAANGGHDHEEKNNENGNEDDDNNNKEESSSITIIDVGANVGLFSLWMANSSKLQAAAMAAASRRTSRASSSSNNSTAATVASVTIHALEPSPHTFQLLKSNVAKVQQATQQQQQPPPANIRIVPHQLAISSSSSTATDQQEELTFTTYPRCSGWSTFHRDESSLYHDLHSYLTQRILSLFGSTIGSLINGTLLKLIYPLIFRLLTSGVSTSSVPVTNLSSFIQQHDIQKIDLLKIDVERHEYQVLLGILHDSDWMKIQAIVLEAEAHQSDIIQLLRERGGFDIVEEIKDPFMAKTPHSMIWALRSL